MRDSRAITTEPPPPPADRRFAYGREPLQFGDLRLPPGDGPHPLVVAIHGGFWRAQHSLTTTAHLCHALASRGVATWNLEYRRLGDPGGGWPGTFEDVSLGVRHVRRLVEEYRLETGVVVFGHSAGGHLALLAAREAPVQTVVSLAGVVDLEQASRLRLGDGVTDDLLGGTPDEVPETYRRASPSALLPLGVRQVLVHGTADEIVPFDFSERYVAKAQAAGDDAALVRLDGVGHFEPIDPQSDVFERMLDLLAGSSAGRSGGSRRDTGR